MKSCIVNSIAKPPDFLLPHIMYVGHVGDVPDLTEGAGNGSARSLRRWLLVGAPWVVAAMAVGAWWMEQNRFSQPGDAIDEVTLPEPVAGSPWRSHG